MDQNNKSSDEVKFPVLCYYKIIAEDHAGIEERIKKALESEGIFSELKLGRKSSHEKYITFNVDILVVSKEYMERIDAVLRNIQGVKFVL